MPLIKDLISLPDRVHRGDFVLRLAEGISAERADETLRDYVVTQQLAGAFDKVSVSVNAPDAAAHERLCRPSLGPQSWPALEAFVAGAKRSVGNVVITAVAAPGVDPTAVANLAKRWGAGFRLRRYAAGE